MAAVADTNLVAMANLWGTDDGPMIGRMDPDQLRMRLTVMQRYLRHDRYELRDQESSLFGSQEGRRHYQVRVYRSGCVADIPIELVLVGRGWFVTNVDLAAAGSPVRRCRRNPNRSGTRD